MNIINEIKNCKENQKIAIKINNEFTVYTTISNLKNEKIFFEDGCYDVFLDFSSDKEYLGWYKRYGLLSFENGNPALFRDGDNWKMFEDELYEIPYFFHPVEKDPDKSPGFYNLQEEEDFPEEDYEKTFSCYYFEPIYSIKIKKIEDFDTEEIVY